MNDLEQEIISLTIAVENMAKKIEWLGDKIDQLIALQSMENDLRKL